MKATNRMLPEKSRDFSFVCFNLKVAADSSKQSSLHRFKMRGVQIEALQLRDEYMAYKNSLYI